MGASTAVAGALDRSQALRVGLHPAESRGSLFSLELFRAAAPGMAEWRGALSAGWLWSARRGPARGWLDASIGGGAILQTSTGNQARWSGLVTAGPSAGLAVEVTPRLGIWSQARLPGLVYRRDGRASLSIAQSLFFGVSLAI